MVYVLSGVNGLITECAQYLINECVQITDLTGWNSGAIQNPVCSALAMKTRRLPSSQRRIIVVRSWSDVLTEWRIATMSWVFALDDVALIS